MYIYIQSEPGLYTTGFYEPGTNKFIGDDDFNDRELARARCAWLNGASIPAEPTELQGVQVDFLAASEWSKSDLTKCANYEPLRILENKNSECLPHPALIHKYDARVLINGEPPHFNFRIITDEFYQSILLVFAQLNGSAGNFPAPPVGGPPRPYYWRPWMRGLLEEIGLAAEVDLIAKSNIDGK